ncbi:MAG TPA: PQQ-binding-like beta-propeller repeat protein [Candidatus Acidoferrales bacterium]|nr:PQQ-binding-like beta-propeller repeat protein [Candidatus Acidoferrales bacterium]
MPTRLSLAVAMCALALPVPAEDWPQWRGPNLNGISGEKDLPLRWSLTENVVWKLAMPSKTGATPIISGNNIFLNVADSDNNLYLWCVDKTKGTVNWKKLITGGNYQINKQNMSSPSPVTDGKNVFVMTGVGILKSFDFGGNEQWMRDIQKEYGKFGLNWGYANSPLLYEDSLYIQVTHGMKTRDPSYILRIDKKTGKTMWRVERPTAAIRESPDSYSTPQLLKYPDRFEIVVLGGDCVTGHDPETGKEVWRGNGLNPTNNPNYRTIASVVIFGDIIYAPTRERPLIAFRAGGKGDITESHKLWEFNNGPDVPTPVTDGKFFYTVNDRGITWCLDARTGKQIWGSKRIKPATYSSSPVLADGKIYITNEEGLTTVLKAGDQFEVLAENDLEDYTLSSPAISGGRIFMRTTHFLYAIGKR